MDSEKKAITIIFPHQLFWPHPAISKKREIILLEEWLFFSQFKFHKIKLAYHRATMQSFIQHLQSEDYACHYVAAVNPLHDIRKFIAKAAKDGVEQMHICNVYDNWLHQRIKKSAKQSNIEIVWYRSPMFLADDDSYQSFFAKQKRYFQTDFYIWQRKRLQLLMEDDERPIGGKWTYDAANRKSYPKKRKPPKLLFPKPTPVADEAWEYVETNYAKNFGEANFPLYPINHKDAEKWLDNFLKERFEQFGDYEDAMVANENFLHHSVLTPMLNIGLLTPDQVIKTTMEYASKNKIPINSLEGFIRQIIGWREFMMAVYQREGSRQRTTNYWKFGRKIPVTFYTGKTGIPPVDDAIGKLLQTGYNHHIERLMILGNFFLLCEFAPNEVYRWFMEMYIDAYDWVMVPNVYGMTQFADGGLITTKPYISGSNYVLKMSNYPKGDWQQVWDGLFWRFMVRQRSFFSQNPRLGMLLNTWDKMNREKQNAHLQHAENFLKKLAAQ